MDKILLVEDDDHIARIEKDFLEVSGYETIHEKEGHLDTILSLMDSVNLVILDIMLPKSDGYEICKKLRSMYDIPIIIISAKTNDMDKVLALGFGANDYMEKPFSPAELVARVKSHINNYNMVKGKNLNEKIISIKDMDIHVEKKQVFINNEEITLTNKEFNILMLLASNKGKVFSKQVIYDKIWNQDSMGYYETVTVHIQRLREKLEPNTKDYKYIKTVWGLGYKIM